MNDTIADIENDENDVENFRLSRKFDVVGFFDVENTERLLDMWQMHTPPTVDDTVVFSSESSLSEAAGLWKVVARQWQCFDSPFTVIVYVQRLSREP